MRVRNPVSWASIGMLIVSFAATASATPEECEGWSECPDVAVQPESDARANEVAVSGAGDSTARLVAVSLTGNATATGQCVLGYTLCVGIAASLFGDAEATTDCDFLCASFAARVGRLP